MDLVSSQNNLKQLMLFQSYGGIYWKDIIPSLTNHSKTLIRLDLVSFAQNVTISFIASFINLQELNISFYEERFFDDFKELQYVKFSQLKILKFLYQSPKYEELIKFLENNGKDLKELYIGDDNDNSLNLAIAKFCPNLQKLSTIFKYYDIETFKKILNCCQDLESIKVWCGKNYLSEEGCLDMIAKHSPKNFYELKMFNENNSELYDEDLELFFTNWNNRRPQRSISFIILKYDICDNVSLEENEENMKIIEKYIELGVIKKFSIKNVNEAK